MRMSLSIAFVLCILSIVSAGPASAQSTGELKLGLSRDFGYGGFGNDIQGLFSLKIKDPPADLTRVEFFVDDRSIGEDIEPPFGLQFNTDSYPLGEHTLSAIGYTSAGNELHSNKITSQFVPANTATDMLAKILVPIFGLILLIALLSVGLPMILNEGKLSSLPLGTARNYGVGGGAICPKCRRPFPLRLWWINLGLSKIDRCPYCGKWSFLRRSSLTELRAAESAELSQSQPEQPASAEYESNKVKREMDESKYVDV